MFFLNSKAPPDNEWAQSKKRTILNVHTFVTGSYDSTRLRLEYPGFDSADPGGRAVYDVGLWPLACWNCGFEARRGHECLCCVLNAGQSR